jgi:hypothetical protein
MSKVKDAQKLLSALLREVAPAEDEVVRLPPRAVRTPKDTGQAATFQSGEREGIIRGSERLTGGGDTEADAAKRVRAYADMLKRSDDEGVTKPWYGEDSETMLALTGRDPVLADRLAASGAVTSQSTDMTANVPFSIKAYNQALVGDKIETGRFPSVMGPRIQAAVDNPDAPLGFKTDPFRQNWSQAWREPSSRSVHDRFDVRVYGFDPKIFEESAGEASHRYLDRLYDDSVALHAKETGRAVPLNYGEGQERTWMLQKADDLQRRFPKITREEALRRSQENFTDLAPRHAANLTYEATPGITTGHQAGAESLSPEAKQELFDLFSTTMRGSENRMGGLAYPEIQQTGRFEGRTNPGGVVPVLTGSKVGSGEVDPASAKLMDALAAMRGLASPQDAVAWTRLGGKASQKEAGGVSFPGATRDQATALRALAMQKALAEEAFDVMPTRTGAAAPIFGAPRQEELTRRLMQAGDELGLKGQPAQLSGSFIEAKGPTGAFSLKPYLDAVEKAGPEVVARYDALMQERAPALLKGAAYIRERYGLETAKYWDTMMEALQKGGGLASLIELQKKGIIPAIALAGFMHAVDQPDEGTNV